MHRFGNRRRNYGRENGKISPLLIVLICVLVAVTVTVIIGNLLKVWLDDEAYQKLISGTEEKEDEDPVYQSYLRDVHAYPYQFGENTDRIWEYPDVSFSINRPNGTVNYTSEVAEYFGLSRNGEYQLQESMITLSSAATYISGVFYPQSFAQTSSDLRYAASVREVALLREFLRAGGSEILLCSLPFDSVETDEILNYVSAVKAAAEDAPVGVVIPLSVAQSENGWEIIGKLLQICDFCALDLQTVSASDEVSATPAEQLAAVKAYLTMYDMRLLLSEEQLELIAEAEHQPVSDFQVVTAFPPEPLPDAEEE